ncbi:hypothetical protein E2542_SST22238 [Spatholobus suberectus]|nr:hypothetical protein E2542_SST22238 [Spatholobus suberectus]
MQSAFNHPVTTHPHCNSTTPQPRHGSKIFPLRESPSVWVTTLSPYRDLDAAAGIVSRETRWGSSFLHRRCLTVATELVCGSLVLRALLG